MNSFTAETRFEAIPETYEADTFPIPGNATTLLTFLGVSPFRQDSGMVDSRVYFPLEYPYNTFV